MAVAIDEKKDLSTRFRTQVDEQIAQATGRIRAHDLTLGGLTLAAIAAVYVTAMIVIDKSINLPEGLRQVGLAAFLLVEAAVGYWLVLRPLRLRVNPLYAAARVEKTIDDPKNSVTGYVEAQEKGDIHVAVKTAMGARAARVVGEADVNRAVDHRSLLVAGGVLLVFLLTLAVLFFVFRPGQFRSLMARAVYPFSSDPIARRTQIELLKPEPAEPTITTGQTITVAVHIGGKVPARNAPDRVRVLLRHNLADPDYEEIAMDEGETSRDWQVKVPDYLVQNGFWYKVTAGDNETPEYRVTVRTLPTFEQYDVTYEYPTYTRKRPDKSTAPNLRAYKGTKITLVTKTNREVKEGILRFSLASLDPVPGKVVSGRPDTMEFKFKATEASPYKLNMTPVGPDKNTDSPSFTLSIDSDLAPLVQISKPEEVETTAAANGQIKVDGTIGDDFGIDKVRLRLRIDGRDLAPVPYMNGQSFLRPTDNTWPTDLAFKMSADLAKLKYADGTKFEPKFGGDRPPVLEYWVEAIDNCTETRPVPDWNNQVGNVGRSGVKRLVLTPPETAPEKKQDLDNRKQERGMEEQQFNQEQQKKLDNEDRRKPDQKDEPRKDEGKEPKEGADQSRKEGEPKKDGTQPQSKSGEPKEGGQPQSKKGEPKKDGTQPKGGDANSGQPQPEEGDPKKNEGTEPKGNQPKDGMNQRTGPMSPPKGKEPDKKSADPKQGDAGSDMGQGSRSEPNTPQSKKSDDKKGMNNAGPGGSQGMQDPNATPPTAPMPQSPEEKRAQEEQQRAQERAEREAQQVQQALNRNKGQGGDAKPNPTANAEKERTEPAQPKPQPPQDGMGMEPQPKPQPKGDGEKPMPMPMPGDKNAPAETKPQGKLEEKPNPDSPAKPGPQQSGPKQPMKEQAQPSETRNEPLGGAPGEEKPEPKSTEPKKNDPSGGNKTTTADQKDPKSDPMSGSRAKPAEEQPKEGDPKARPEAQKEMARNAGKPKPNNDPTRGQDKNEEPKTENATEKPTDEPMAGQAKPKQAPPSAENKPMPKNGDPNTGKQPDASENKPAPDPKSPNDKQGGRAGEPKPEPAKPMGGMNEKSINPGEDKPAEQEQRAGGGEGKEPMGKKNVAGGKDGKGNKGDKEKLDDARQKELEQAARDLTSSDPNKQQAARDKLDKELGKDAREAMEKDLQAKKAELDRLEKDRQSPDRATREKAEKRLKEMQEQARKEAEKHGKDGKGRELSQDEIKELAEKAQDLNSKDDARRKSAEQALDDKLGKDAREKIQDEMKKRENDPNRFGPDRQNDLQKKIEEAARDNKPRFGKDPIQKHNSVSGASDEPPLPAMEDDPRNRARSAQLQLEEFEKHRYDRDLQDRLKWTDKEYEDFLKAQRERVEQMNKEADAFEQAQRDKPKAPMGAPTITTAKGGKVESREPGANLKGQDDRLVVPPPGFGGAREKFIQPRSRPKR